MIYVTIGVTMPFTRLIKKIDEISPFLKDEIVMQIGKTQYKPSNPNIKFFRFCSLEDQQKYIRNADVVISHLSGGIMLDIAYCDKRAILVPRAKEYGEAINDNQIQLVERIKMSKKNILIINNLDEIETTLGNIEKIPRLELHNVRKIRERIREAVVDLISE